MSTQIQTLCAHALTRIGINPTQATREKLDDFVRAIDSRSAHLDVLDRIELENAVVEYTVAWATADLLENTCGIQGPLTKTGRANPALAQAATARNRMRHILKSIKTLLKSKSHSTQAEGEAPAEPPHTNTATSTAPQAHAETAHPTQAEGEAPAEPPRENPTTQSQTQAKPPQAIEPEPAAPPMNRTQRRAQARLEAKLHRKAQKRLRRQKQSANESTSAPTTSTESTPARTHAVVGNHSCLKS